MFSQKIVSPQKETLVNPQDKAKMGQKYIYGGEKATGKVQGAESLFKTTLKLLLF